MSNAEVHLWRSTLDLEGALLKRLEQLLAPEELDRADRFVFPPDRQHFVAAHGILRTLLGYYLGRHPAELTFCYGAHDKPALASGAGSPQLHFNLSHSHGLAVVAVTKDRQIGVDIESIRPDFATEEIAAGHFSARERAELRALPRELRAEAFFLCWTRKEAYVKARGDGLGLPLQSFDVSLTPGGPVELRSTDQARWALRSFQPAPGYAGAVVCEGSDWRHSFSTWQLASP